MRSASRRLKAQVVNGGVDHAGILFLFRLGNLAVQHIRMMPLSVGKQQRRDVVATFGLQRDRAGALAADVGGMGVDSEYFEVSRGSQHFLWPFRL